MERRALELTVDPTIRELGSSLLDDIDRLADDLVARIYEHEPAYAEHGAVAEDDLRASVRTNLARALEALAGQVPDGEDWSDRAVATGRRRARQGMPLEAVLRAYRLGGSVIWEALVEAARGSGSDLECLLDAAGPVWQVIDTHSARMSAAYRLEEDRLRTRDLRRRQGVLEGLLEGRGADPTFAQEAARTLAMPVDGPLLCVVALFDRPVVEPLRAPQEYLASRGISSVWLARGGAEIGLVDLGTADAGELRRLLRRRTTGRVGTVAVPGFEDVPRGQRLALLAARTLPDATAGVEALEDRLPEALVAGSPDVADELVRRTLGPLLDLPRSEREAMVDTVEAYLACDGSPSTAAHRLYCHRNTVTYRVRRVEELTGRSLGTPRDRLLWTLALCALRQSEPVAAAE